jgi:streptogramin lyase
MARTRFLLIPVAALGAALLASHAQGLPGDGLPPGQAQLATLGEARAVTYYTIDRGGAFRVVTTIAAGEDALPVRATVTLQPGQSASISVPGPSGAAPHEVTFRRSGDRLLVEAPRQEDAALR